MLCNISEYGERKLIEEPPEKCVAKTNARVWLTNMTGSNLCEGVDSPSNGISTNKPELPTPIRYVLGEST